MDDIPYLVDTEGNNLADPDWLGMLAGLGIIEGKPFEPDARTNKILADAAKTGYATSRVLGLQGTSGDADFRVYKDRQWVNPVNNMESHWPNSLLDLSFKSHAGSYRDLDARVWFFTDYYSISPGMVSMTPGKGAFYMIAFNDSDGMPLVGANSYKLKLPPNIPTELFWSVTLYEAENASGLDNGQPFPGQAQQAHARSRREHLLGHWPDGAARCGRQLACRGPWPWILRDPAPLPPAQASLRGQPFAFRDLWAWVYRRMWSQGLEPHRLALPSDYLPRRVLPCPSAVSLWSPHFGGFCLTPQKGIFWEISKERTPCQARPA